MTLALREKKDDGIIYKIFATLCWPKRIILYFLWRHANLQQARKLASMQLQPHEKVTSKYSHFFPLSNQQKDLFSFCLARFFHAFKHAFSQNTWLGFNDDKQNNSSFIPQTINKTIKWKTWVQVSALTISSKRNWMPSEHV